MEELSAKAGSNVSKIEKSKEKAERLISVIANTEMVGDYHRVANEERKAGRFWDGVSLLSLAGMVGFAIYSFHGTSVEFSVGMFLARLGVALTFGALSGYAARQSDKHHQVERRNRRVEHELALLDSFLAELPDSERDKVIASVTDRLIARGDLQGGRHDEQISENRPDTTQGNDS